MKNFTSKKLRELLKNVGEIASTRQKSAKKGSLYQINGRFEQIFNVAMVTQVGFQRFLKITIASCLVITVLTACSGSEEREAKYLEKAQAFFSEENFEKSKIEAKNVLQINPKNIQARFLIAKIHLEEGEYRQAFANFNNVIEEDNTFLDAHLQLARILFTANENISAREHIDKVLAERPNDKDARIILAGLHQKNRKIEEAQNLAEEVLTEHPGEVGAIAVLVPIYSETSPQKALDLINDGLKIDKASLALKELKIRVLSSQKNAREVESILLEITEENPEKVNYFYRLARGYAFQNRLEETESILKKAVEKNPESDEAKIKLIEFTAQRLGTEKAENLINQLIADEPEKFKYKELLVQLYMSSNRTEDGKNLLKKMIIEGKKSPSALSARNTLADLHLLERDKDSAEKLINEVFEVEPSNTGALIIRSRINLSEENNATAIADLRAALKNDSESIPALKLLALAQEREGLTNLALDNYRRVINLDDSDINSLLSASRISYQDRNPGHAEKYLNRALEVAPENQQAITLLSTILSDNGEWDKAHRLINTLLRNNDTKSTGLLLKARLYRKNNQWDEARPLYTEAVELSPTNFEAVGGYVDTFLIDKNYDGAINFLNKHTKTYPDMHSAKDILATVHIKNADNNSAKSIYNEMINHLPNNETVYQKLAALYQNEKNYSEVEKVYLKGIQNNPTFYGLRVYLANHYEQQQNYDASKYQYEEALKLQPNLDIIKNNLAVLLVNYFPSEDNYKRALELASTITDQKQAVYIDTIGWVHYHLGNMPQAISYLEAAVDRQNNAHEFRYHLGMAYHKSGQVDKAKEQLQLAISDERQNYHGLNEAKKTLELL